jgi:hypothetical protein
MIKKMKHIILISLCLVLSIKALASESEGLYLGVGFGLSSAHVDCSNKLNNNFVGPSSFNLSSRNLSLFTGIKFNEHLGSEFGFSFPLFRRNKNLKYHIAGNNNEVNVIIKSIYKFFYFDLIGYSPINEELDILASLGISRISQDLEIYSGIPDQFLARLESHGATYAPRFGVGASYKLSEKICARAMLRHENFVHNVNNTSINVELICYYD